MTQNNNNKKKKSQPCSWNPIIHYYGEDTIILVLFSALARLAERQSYIEPSAPVTLSGIDVVSFTNRIQASTNACVI